MPEADPSALTPRSLRGSLRRWLLAAVGVVCVALGALGVVLPGLPTTIFLIVASWCFARSCPWLEDRLVRTRFFRPFLGYLDGARMPFKAVVVTLVVMWTAIAISTVVLARGDDPRPLIAAIVPVAGLVGSVFVVRMRAKGGGTTPRRHREVAGSDWSEGAPEPGSVD